MFNTIENEIMIWLWNYKVDIFFSILYVWCSVVDFPQTKTLGRYKIVSLERQWRCLCFDKQQRATWINGPIYIYMYKCRACVQASHSHTRTYDTMGYIQQHKHTYAHIARIPTHTLNEHNQHTRDCINHFNLLLLLLTFPHLWLYTQLNWIISNL